MDPPPLSPHPTMKPTTMQTVTATTSHLNYLDSTNSSPKSHYTDTWDEPLPPVPGAKFRLMCSYGGRIIPRPHDMSLCYVGGDTRIVVVDRNSSFSDFQSRLSHTLLNGRQFTLKCQLPNENLDSLISITTDEDLEHMIEKHDRMNSTSPLKPSRLRLFLFLDKPETVASMGCLLDDAKSETWFVDALNGADFLPRGLSDSAADILLELDEPQVNRDSGVDVEAQYLTSSGKKQVIYNVMQEVQSTLSDSPTVETTSSLEFSVSSPSMLNLPPIKVRIEETYVRLGGLDEQFSQMNYASNAQKQDDRCINLTAAPHPFPKLVGVAGVSSAAVAGENLSRIFFDGDKSDQEAPNEPQKPPLPLQPVSVLIKLGDVYSLPSPDSKHAVGYNLPSLDSIASDSSVASAASLSKHAICQDGAPIAIRENRIPPAVVDTQSNITDPSPQIQMQQVPETMVLPLSQQIQLQQQQFVQTSAHYIQHPATGQVPISSYYTVYASPPQQAIHQQTDQQYPMYLLPVTQTQPYNLTMQSNLADATSVAASRQLTTLNPTFVPSTAYKGVASPIYPAKTSTLKPEMPANLYRTIGTAAPTLVQVPANQFQQQFYGLSQMPPPSQSVPAGSASATNYVYEYTHPVHDHAHYAQHPTATLPQYQTMAPAAAVMVSQTSTQLTTDNTSQQISSSQL